METRRRAYAYVFEGAGTFRDAARPEGVLLEKEVAGQEVNIRDLSGNRTLVRFGAGDEVTGDGGARGRAVPPDLGRAIEEPVAWAGPIVMNSRAETGAGLQGTAQRDLHQTRALSDGTAVLRRERAQRRV